jgi:hypothetical protein
MKPDRCPTCRRKMTRSTEQNRRYWAILHRLAEALRPLDHSYSASSWHEWAKSKWLGCNEFALPNGKTLTIPRSTADLDVSEFHDYATKVEVWANEHDVFLEDDPAA